MSNNDKDESNDDETVSCSKFSSLGLSTRRRSCVMLPQPQTKRGSQPITSVPSSWHQKLPTKERSDVGFIVRCGFSFPFLFRNSVQSFKVPPPRIQFFFLCESPIQRYKFGNDLSRCFRCASMLDRFSQVWFCKWQCVRLTRARLLSFCCHRHCYELIKQMLPPCSAVCPRSF